MNLRSGVVTQEMRAGNKTKETHVTNKSKEMEMSGLEQNLKSMLTDFKGDISKQIGELRLNFSSEMKQMRKDVKSAPH